MLLEINAKRIFDILLALAGILISLPLWFFIALIILFEDGLPVFYRQQRIGLHGRIFKAIKFRSMIKAAETGTGPVQAEENDSRATIAGRFLRPKALDELPQLLNIFAGDMSFVGPRALRPAEIGAQDKKLKHVSEFAGFKERASVVPGLTGPAQIFAPRNADRGTKFKYDLWYIENRNFQLDIKLLAYSFLITFIGRWEINDDKFKSLGQGLKNRINNEI